ncbi:MAG: tyrosine-type recombinase/integrase, partial [Thermoplasmata archaeon]
WRICKRVQRAAGIEESVHPHRFRKTLATCGKQMGLDPQFLQAILAHESVNITLDEYARVELEDVKREFARMDLLAAVEGRKEGPREQGPLLVRLRDLAPPGKERAWQMIIDGLEGLLGEPVVSADAMH